MAHVSQQATQLSQEQIARIEESRQRALERKRKFEESQACAPANPSNLLQHRQHLQPANLSQMNSAPVSQKPPEQRTLAPIFRDAFPQNTPPTASKAASWNSAPKAQKQDASFFKADKSRPSSREAAELGEANLSEEQTIVLEEIMAGKNVFITGCGGTGKSHLMHHAIKAMRKLRGKHAVAVTATTGIAACHIGGTSLHGFAGIGLGAGSVPELVKKVRGNRQSCSRWQRTQVLIVDEISMLDAELFDKLEAVAREVRGEANRPFGGMQVILVGDFLQLPPVGKNGQAVTFCFDSKSWKRVIKLHVELKHVFRQSNMDFVNLLNAVRWGQCTDEIERALMATRKNDLNEAGGLKATRLYAKNMQVDEINNRSLFELDGKLEAYKAEDTGEYNFVEQLKKNCLAPEKLDLKVGAQVMLLKNLDPERNLINGTRGVVSGFQTNDDPDMGEVGHWPVVRFETVKGEHELVMTKEEFTIEGQGKVLAKRSQIPLRLAYAITIHKCQGMTLSKVEMSLKDVFEPGQAYVALSRVSSLEGLRLLDFSPRAVRAHPRVVQFYREMNSPTTQMETQRAEGTRQNPLLSDDF